jgi:hypothetical protein
MSIYSNVRNLLVNDSTLQTLLGGTETNQKVFFQYPKNSIDENVPCITYYFNEVPEFREPYTSKDGLLFLDIWSKDNLNDIYERVLVLFHSSPFFSDVSQAMDLFEQDTGIYHKHLTIKILGG